MSHLQPTDVPVTSQERPAPTEDRHPANASDDRRQPWCWERTFEDDRDEPALFSREPIIEG